jgi:hypothetical protein
VIIHSDESHFVASVLYTCYDLFSCICMIPTRTEICIGRTFLDRCLELHKNKQLDNGTASMAKYVFQLYIVVVDSNPNSFFFIACFAASRYWLTDLQGKIADGCVQLHGGAGKYFFIILFVLHYFRLHN